MVHAEDCFSCFPQSFALNAFDIRQDFSQKLIYNDLVPFNHQAVRIRGRPTAEEFSRVLVLADKLVLSNGVQMPGIGFGTWQVPTDSTLETPSRRPSSSATASSTPHRSTATLRHRPRRVAERSAAR